MVANAGPWERFPPLEAMGGLRHGFLTRVPHVDVSTVDKAEALRRLHDHHEAALTELGMERWPRIAGQQVHGAEILVVREPEIAQAAQGPVPGIDGFVTDRSGVALVVSVADCAAVYLVDPVHRALGLVHSGRNGTELDITGRAIDRLGAEYGTEPADVTAVISPCIRPPAYEVDFAATIRRQCRERGVPESAIWDDRVCTSSDLERFYSYRMEAGKTGRMLAVMGWEP